ncbi:DNA ligase D [Limimaricola variabilis]|uniref:DNA ligase D n=1 Tax=Limimaricola variabilis TaxID=1492771 RepID=UPI002AC9E257|nr:DNA ligase D [Limimaricola variabilis]WPY95195.1 DNA ligase D [Limimaricola variabilis]
MDRLKDYEAKRDFRATPEPRGKGRRGDDRLSFVVQKHDATRLHYDFRLEHDGALWSWAVTRGPSDDPQEKRLAVRTEDHPLDYAGFEGVIPEGQYGAGTVMLWDRGHWEPQDDDPAAALAAGKLKIRLHGERMRGGWTLVRMKGGRKGDKGRENWLLIKERDETATDQPDALTERHDISIESGRRMEEIAAGKGSKRRKKAEKKTGNGAGRGYPTPAPVTPQLATLRETAPVGEEWWQEPKFDGYRCLLAIGADGVKAWSRNGHDWSDRFAPLIGPAEALPCEAALIDGEVTAGEGGGDFSTLQKALSNGDPLTFYAFDLLHLDGEDLVRKPLRARRAALDALLGDMPEDGAIRLSPYIEGAAEKVLTHLCGAGAEGIICKRADAPYRSGRSTDWIKVKCIKGAEFVIGGWSPSDKRGRPFASLLMGSFEGDRLIYRGRVGTGFDAETMRDLADRIEPLACKSSPFDDVPREVAKDARWITPELVAQVRYAELTADGQLRHGVFQGLREDKGAKEVSAAQELAVDRADGAGEVEYRGIRISSADRVIYPGPALSKGGVARYYDRVAERMMEHAAGRPVALVRMPSGLDGQRFFQRHPGKGFPEAVKSVRLTETNGSSADYITLPDPAALLGAVQMGTLEVHIHGARNDRLDRPDRLVFDLDPDEDLGFAAVRKAAREIGDLMARFGLASAPMVTGGKGVHVVVPLRRTAGWETVRGFAEAVARGFERRAPERFTATASKSGRKGRIFIDWLRNGAAATAVSPYSLRARPGAPVAVPVDWDELARLDRADGFDIEAAVARAQRDCPLLDASRGAPGLSQSVLDAMEDWLEEAD